MALTNQFFVKGLDFTGFATVTAADFNNLVDLAQPKSDSSVEGKGTTVWTKDSALDTPIVPDAVTITTFKRCIWVRVLHLAAASPTPLFYAWDDNAVSDATFLKWKRIQADLTDIQAELDALEIQVDNVEAVANNALVVAGVANTNAAAAVVTASSALATANTANANALAASASAADANGIAGQALTTADQALAAANASQVTANNALANSSAVAANKFYTSAEAAIIDGVIIDTAHGLGATPKFVRGVLVCKVAELGYIISDEVGISAFDNPDNNVNPFAIGVNASNIFAICSYIARISIPSKATPSAPTDITPGSWRVKLYAWL